MSKETKSPIGSFNLKKYIIECFKSWRVFLISVLVCGFLGCVLAVIRPAKKEVFAQLILKEDSGSGSMMMAGQIARSFALGDMFGTSSSTDNETFVLKSHSVFLQTAKQMGLNITYFSRPYGVLSREVTKNIPYNLEIPAGISDTLSRTLKFDLKRTSDDNFNIQVKLKRKVIGEVKNQALPATIKTDWGTFTIAKTPAYNIETVGKKFRITLSSFDAAASAYEKLVNIYVPDRKSDFIDLSFVTDNPAFGEEILDHVINNYINLSNVYKTDRTAESLRLVDDRLESLASELLTSEHALEKFKKDNNLTDVEIDAQYLMTKTGTLEASLLEAQTNFELVKLTRDFIKNPENNYSLIPDLSMNASGLGDNGGGGLIAQYNQLILERMELSNSGKTNNSTTRQLDQQIDALRANIITSVDRMYQNAALTLSDLKGENSKNKSRLSSLPTIERQYIVLKRDNLLQEQIYLFLLQQREELNMNLGSRSFPAQVIDYPYVLPDEVGLSTKMKLAFAVLLGLIIGAVYVLLVKMRNSPVTSKKEADATLKAPILQALATDSKGLDGDANEETFRHLRSDIQSALKDCDGKVVAVTSMYDKEGKTYVSVNLAESMAKAGKKVLIVDADLRNPSVASALGISGTDRQISNYVYSRTTAIDTATVTVDEHNALDILATNTPEPNAGDLVASEKFAELIGTLKNDYDFVIIDSARISGYSDIYSLTDIADITLIVCRSKKVSAADLDAINALYTDGRLKRIAVVENGFS